MAAFTTMALLGLAGAAGLFGGKKLAQVGQQPQQSLAAPGPTNAAQPTIAAPTAPPTQAQQSSSGVAAGMQAAAKQRARMTPAKGNGLAPSIIRAPRPVLQANTIAGGY